MPEPLRQGDGGSVAAPGFERAEEGIAVVHRLELDEDTRLRRPARATGHGAHLREVGELGGRPLHVGTLLVIQVPVDGADGEVAAEDLPPVRAKPGDDRARGREHPGDGRHPEGEAAEKDPEPAESADAVAKLAGGEPQGGGRHRSRTSAR